MDAESKALAVGNDAIWDGVQDRRWKAEAKIQKLHKQRQRRLFKKLAKIKKKNGGIVLVPLVDGRHVAIDLEAWEKDGARNLPQDLTKNYDTSIRMDYFTFEQIRWLEDIEIYTEMLSTGIILSEMQEKHHEKMLERDPSDLYPRDNHFVKAALNLRAIEKKKMKQDDSFEQLKDGDDSLVRIKDGGDLRRFLKEAQSLYMPDDQPQAAPQIPPTQSQQQVTPQATSAILSAIAKIPATFQALMKVQTTPPTAPFVTPTQFQRQAAPTAPVNAQLVAPPVPPQQKPEPEASFAQSRPLTAPDSPANAQANAHRPGAKKKWDSNIPCVNFILQEIHRRRHKDNESLQEIAQHVCLSQEQRVALKLKRPKLSKSQVVDALKNPPQ